MHLSPGRLWAVNGSWRTPALLLVLGLFFQGAANLRAQDVVVGEPVCTLPASPPDELPQTRKQLRADYPDEMRQTGETGYVIFTCYLDATGVSRQLRIDGTHLPFQRAVEEAYSDWKMTPARQQGVAIDTRFWLPVIFNPKSARLKAKDAIPRLLAVAPVMTKGGEPHLVVRMTFSLDEEGTIIRAEPEQTGINPAVLTAIRESLLAWRFAPARKAGVPVAAEITLAVICQAQPKTKQAKQVPPKALKQVAPVYPYAMNRFGLRGTVRLSFEIDAEGVVRNPTVLRSDNPAFDEPALEAALQWKFAPATSEGKPVKTKAQQELNFTLAGDEDRDAFSIQSKGNQAKLPPEFRYDTAPKIRNVQVPVYPAELRRTGLTGQARIAMVVNAQGRIAEVQVVEADQPEFGLALAAAVEGFRFDPALKNGQPSPSILGFKQEFSEYKLPDAPASRLLMLERKQPEKIVSLAVLDTPLKPVSQPAPVFPVTASPAADRGRALIEFLVDENGRARLPQIVEASEPAFGYAAVQAVTAWWFERPLKNGKPVIVRVRVPVEFIRPTKS